MTIQRTYPPAAADEATTLLAFLDFQRATLLRQTEGLDGADLQRTLGPSPLTLGGLLKHLAFVEGFWFRYVFAGEEQVEPWASVDWKADRDWDFHSAADDSPEELRALFDAEVLAADAVLHQALVDGDLGALAARVRHGKKPSLRWIVVHMVEEYARHCGHADLIRESIDGARDL
ncbi:DinB family protein [Nocardioides euryhalodurans]|uniref:DinB family protein n=1 Tax=Nocardioides euryhalodurans TaxID=2518370 RepID=A0A4P7GP91_9ACTN|nr:DinB family protein [Nocardioides euryhalodurans]QBR93597.1 DinB family protein [Nocardioides euryhalodurans]